MTEIDWAALKKTADDATKPLSPGRYDVIITKAEAKTASTGSPMIVAQLRVIGGPSDGKTLFHNFVLTVDNAFALKMFFDALEAFGITMDMLQAAGSRLDLLASPLIGRQASAEATIRVWQGQERNNLGAFQRTANTIVGGTVGSVQSGIPGATGMSTPAPSGIPTPGSAPAGPPIPSSVPISPSSPPPGLPI